MIEIDSDRFRSQQLVANMYGRIYGGQLLANALGAAMQTAPWRPHTLHAFFLNSGSVAKPVAAAVSRMRDGRRFAHRRVDVTQEGRILLAAEVSFHQDEQRPAHQYAQMPRVPPPEELQTLEELVAYHGSRLSRQTAQRMLSRTNVLIKPVDSMAGILEPTAQACLAIWLKPAGPISDRLELRYCALAFMSDSWLNAACCSSLVDSVFDGSFEITSLNHALWFHREPQVDDWLLYCVESPIVEGLRGLARGALFDRDGHLVASSAQEALLTPNPALQT